MERFLTYANRLTKQISTLHRRLDALSAPRPPKNPFTPIQFPSITGSYVKFTADRNGNIIDPPKLVGSFRNMPFTPSEIASFVTCEPFFTTLKTSIDTHRHQTLTVLVIPSPTIQYRRIVQFVPINKNKSEIYVFETTPKQAHIKSNQKIAL